MASGLGKQSHTSLGRALILESDSPEHTAEWLGVGKSLFVWNGAVGVEWETSVSNAVKDTVRGSKPHARFRADPGEPHLPLKTPSWTGRLTPFYLWGLLFPEPSNPGSLCSS